MDGQTMASNGAHNGKRSVGARVDRLGSSAQQLWSTTVETVSELRDTLDLPGRVHRHPYRMIALSAGVGYVLAGGLFSRLTARVLGFGLRMGLRLAALPYVRDELLGIAAGVSERVRGEEGDEPTSSSAGSATATVADAEERWEGEGGATTGTAGKKSTRSTKQGR